MQESIKLSGGIQQNGRLESQSSGLPFILILGHAQLLCLSPPPLFALPW